MPVYQLNSDTLIFPPAEDANPDGLLAVGGHLSEDWLLTAYALGIFPWFNQGDPILWWSPDPRMVLLPKDVHISKSMHPMLNNSEYEFRLDTAFEMVMRQCAKVDHRSNGDTWITDRMIEAYTNLHKSGMAHSAEIWYNGELVGGLYGVSIGGAFFGESMFSKIPNTSKLCLFRACQWLESNGVEIIDCQVYSRHLSKMGANEISRYRFLEILDAALSLPNLQRKWKI